MRIAKTTVHKTEAATGTAKKGSRGATGNNRLITEGRLDRATANTNRPAQS